jgi:hypothetical protein
MEDSTAVLFSGLFNFDVSALPQAIWMSARTDRIKQVAIRLQKSALSFLSNPLIIPLAY